MHIILQLSLKRSKLQKTGFLPLRIIHWLIQTVINETTSSSYTEIINMYKWIPWSIVYHIAPDKSLNEISADYIKQPNWLKILLQFKLYFKGHQTNQV